MYGSATTLNQQPLAVELPAWLISDTHFFHTRLAEVYEAETRQALGDDHNTVMLERWLETVKETDSLIHFGDLALGSKVDFEAIADLLPGQKSIILGNHDRRGRSWYRGLGFTLLPVFRFHYYDYTVVCSHYPDDDQEFVCYPKTINIHGHVHSQTRADRRLINISVEAIDFRPLWSSDLLDQRIAELEGISLDELHQQRLAKSSA